MNSKPLHMLAYLLLFVGGINWGLVGLLNFNLVTTIFGNGMFANVIYILVGLSTVVVLLTHKGDCRVCGGK